MVSNEDGLTHEVHCFIDDNEVSVRECDSEEEFDEKEPLKSTNIEKKNYIADGSELIKIVVRQGQVFEKQYRTPDGEVVTINFS